MKIIIEEKNSDVHIGLSNKGWFAEASTHNWAGDFFHVEGKSKEDVKNKLRSAIKKDGEEIWLLDNPLLK